MILGIILFTIGTLMLIEGLFASLCPKVIRKMTKNIKQLRKAGILEIVVAVIFIALGLWLA